MERDLSTDRCALSGRYRTQCAMYSSTWLRLRPRRFRGRDLPQAIDSYTRVHPAQRDRTDLEHIEPVLNIAFRRVPALNEEAQCPSIRIQVRQRARLPVVAFFFSCVMITPKRPQIRSRAYSQSTHLTMYRSPLQAVGRSKTAALAAGMTNPRLSPDTIAPPRDPGGYSLPSSTCFAPWVLHPN